MVLVLEVRQEGGAGVAADVPAADDGAVAGAGGRGVHRAGGSWWTGATGRRGRSSGVTRTWTRCRWRRRTLNYHLSCLFPRVETEAKWKQRKI